MVTARTARRAGTLAVALAISGGALVLGAGPAPVDLPECAHAPVRLHALFDAATPGAPTPTDAVAHLAGATDATVALGSDAGALQLDVAEARDATAIVTAHDAAGALVAVARTRPHPAGGWIADEVLTCSVATGEASS